MRNANYMKTRGHKCYISPLQKRMANTVHSVGWNDLFFRSSLLMKKPLSGTETDNSNCSLSKSRLNNKQSKQEKLGILRCLHILTQCISIMVLSSKYRFETFSRLKVAAHRSILMENSWDLGWVIKGHLFILSNTSIKVIIF